MAYRDLRIHLLQRSHRPKPLLRCGALGRPDVRELQLSRCSPTPPSPGLLRERLEPALASVARPGYEACLHAEPATQQLWLVEHRNDSHGEDWTATPARGALAASFAGGTLVVGGRASLPTVDLEAAVGACVRHPRVNAHGAWLTIFDDLELPFDCIVRDSDGAGSCVQQQTLDFPADPAVGIVGRLARTGSRLVFGLRLRLGRLPRGTHSYP